MSDPTNSKIPKDQLAKDLNKILDDSWVPVSSQFSRSKLMMKLVSYIVRRDAKVWNHAYNLGKKESQRAKNSEK